MVLFVNLSKFSGVYFFYCVMKFGEIYFMGVLFNYVHFIFFIGTVFVIIVVFGF